MKERNLPIPLVITTGHAVEKDMENLSGTKMSRYRPSPMYSRAAALACSSAVPVMEMSGPFVSSSASFSPASPPVKVDDAA
jgi:hypothetical protein